MELDIELDKISSKVDTININGKTDDSDNAQEKINFDELVDIELNDSLIDEEKTEGSIDEYVKDEDLIKKANSNCILCKNNLGYALSYCIMSDYKYCKGCFHIQKSLGVTNYEKVKIRYNTDTFTEYVLSKMSERQMNSEEDIKILVLNDTDTQLIDCIYEKMSEKVNKYRLKTVSASPLYNNSFFSQHKHNKFALTEYISEMLSNEWDKFDVIVLNDILTYAKNPCEILKCCKSISHDNTIILSVNLHTSIIYNMELLNMDVNVNNIFNTNSLKKACCNTDLKLEQALVLDKIWVFSTISGSREEYVSKQVANKLYDELTCNIYEKISYDTNDKYWHNYFTNLNSTLKKYSDVGYQLVLIGDLPDDKRYGDIEYDKYIQVKDLQMIDSLCGNVYTVIVITDYNNTKSIRDTIIKHSKKSFIVYDLFYLIGYELEAMSF